MNAPQDDLLFDLTLSDEQRMNRDTLQRFAASEITPAARNADETRQAPEGFYQQSAELGLALMQIPEALGGAGMGRSPMGNTLNAEDLARGDMSLALGALSPLAFVNALLDFGTETQQEQYLPQFCEGQFVSATTALLEPRATFEPTQLACTAERRGDNIVLNGCKTMVPLGLDAQLVLVIAELAGTGPAAFIVEGQPPGLSRRAETHMGLRPLQLATLEFDAVEIPASAQLGSRQFDLQRFNDLAAIGLCALAVGCCQAVLDYVKDYCNERVAFGEPITNRQSVAFMIADIATELEAMRLMTWRAAARAERGQEFHQQAYLAKTFCAEQAMKIGTDGVQLLGGHGFCREHPVEMWYRNLRAIAILDGVAGV